MSSCIYHIFNVDHILMESWKQLNDLVIQENGLPLSLRLYFQNPVLETSVFPTW
ncbi:hypothetical protein AtEden1_Chr1g0074641 [Arabidopsis thaliana]